MELVSTKNNDLVVISGSPSTFDALPNTDILFYAGKANIRGEVLAVIGGLFFQKFCVQIQSNDTLSPQIRDILNSINVRFCENSAYDVPPSLHEASSFTSVTTSDDEGGYFFISSSRFTRTLLADYSTNIVRFFANFDYCFDPSNKRFCDVLIGLEILRSNKVVDRKNLLSDEHRAILLGMGVSIG